MYRFRLHTKFLVLVVGSLAVFLGVLSFIVIQREARMLVQKASEKQHLLARAILAHVKDSMIEGTPRSTLVLMESLRGSHGLERLEVLRRDGTPAFGAGGGRFDVPRLEQAFDTGEETDFQERGLVPLQTSLLPLKNEGLCRRCHVAGKGVLGVIVVSFSREGMIEESVRNRRELIFFFSAVILAVGGMLYAAVRTVMLKPIETLHRGAEAIGKGDFSHRIELLTGDEFQDVANAFNRTAEQLSETCSGMEKMIVARTQELDESFRILGGIISTMPGGVLFLDMAGHVKLINPYAARLLRCNEADVIGKDLAAAVPETAVFIAAAFDKPGSEFFLEAVYTAPDGMTVPLGFSSTYYRGAMGGYEGVIIVFRDLTELKTLQAELIDKERFAAMGRVVAGVAHEVRNPLFGISSIGQIFERELTNPAHLELVRALLSEARRLNQLVEDLLLYGRPTQMKLEPCDLRRLWQEVLEAYRDETLMKGVRMAGDDGTALPRLFADPHQVRQVFLNLFRNALDASPPGTEIAVRFLIADQYISFELRDEGDGIPVENREKVFDLFFTTKPKGTGLGLAICKKIVEDHGGDIEIKSVEGTGTTVTVRLPYRRTPEASNSK